MSRMQPGRGAGPSWADGPPCLLRASWSRKDFIRACQEGRLRSGSLGTLPEALTSPWWRSSLLSHECRPSSHGLIFSFPPLLSPWEEERYYRAHFDV